MYTTQKLFVIVALTIYMARPSFAGQESRENGVGHLHTTENFDDLMSRQLKAGKAIKNKASKNSTLAGANAIARANATPKRGKIGKRKKSKSLSQSPTMTPT